MFSVGAGNRSPVIYENSKTKRPFLNGDGLFVYFFNFFKISVTCSTVAVLPPFFSTCSVINEIKISLSSVGYPMKQPLSCSFFSFFFFISLLQFFLDLSNSLFFILFDFTFYIF